MASICCSASARARSNGISPARLVVGQFSDGKLKVYRGLGKGKLAAGEWLRTAGAVAQVPGVW